MTRTMAVGEEEVLRLREPPVVRLVGGIDVGHGEVPEVPERLLEHVHTLALVVRRLHEARDKRGVALGRAFLEEAHLVAPAEWDISASVAAEKARVATYTIHVQERPALSTAVSVQ